MVIMRKSSAGHQIEPLQRPDPQTSGVISKDGSHVIARQGIGACGVVPEGLQDAPARIHPIEAAVEAAHPETTVLVLDDFRDLLPAERSRIIGPVSEMHECLALGLPSVETLCGADPNDSRAVQCDGEDRS